VLITSLSGPLSSPGFRRVVVLDDSGTDPAIDAKCDSPGSTVVPTRQPARGGGLAEEPHPRRKDGLSNRLPFGHVPLPPSLVAFRHTGGTGASLPDYVLVQEHPLPSSKTTASVAALIEAQYHVIQRFAP